MSCSLSCKQLMCWLVLGFVWSWACGDAAAQKIYIMTDLEGASGVYKFAQTREPDPALKVSLPASQSRPTITRRTREDSISTIRSGKYSIRLHLMHAVRPAVSVSTGTGSTSRFPSA